uniref:hypothetical protein n=1 Tax=Methylobacterium sp. B34 TaxID=95563 RepID=UPI000345BBC2|nr:hypothetical protein [Methylobacterium sp. B34]
MPSVIGDGDLISLANTQHSIVSNNYVFGGGAGGIVASNFIAGPGKVEDYAFNMIANNQVTYSAHACVSIQATTTIPPTAVYDNLVTGNLLHRCGLGMAADNPTNRAGISLFDFTGAQGLARTTLVGNVIRDDIGGHLAGVAVSGVANGQVFAGNNNVTGGASSAITGGISAVTPNGGWGSHATAGNWQTTGSSFSFTITSAGTGQAPNPTVTIATPATTVDQPPVQSCKMVGGTGTVAAIFGEANATAASQALGYAGTPVAGQTYTISCR